MNGGANRGAVHVVDLAPPCADSDNDGLCDVDEDADTDLDGNPATNPGPDHDGDALVDHLDADDDGDGIGDFGDADRGAVARLRDHQQLRGPELGRPRAAEDLAPLGCAPDPA